MLILSLVLDESSDQHLNSLWNIYYHFWICSSDMAILQNQANKLVGLSASASAWEKGPYSRSLRFNDERTMNEVQRIWKSYCKSDDPTNDRTSRSKLLRQRIQQARSFSKRILGEHGVTLTGLRSAAPVGIKALSDTPEAGKHFWEHGTLPFGADAAGKANEPNPTFTSPFTSASALHYGLDPLLGYHLSAAYLEFTRSSTMHNSQPRSTGLISLSVTARFQFKAWCLAYQAAAQKTTIDFIVGDALETCSVLSARNVSSHSDPDLRLYNVIDTSNLIDHLGSLNLLINTIPLMDPNPQSTLYTDTLVQRDSNLGNTFATLLHGDFATMSSLLGVWPVEYWTNASFISPEEATFNAIYQQFSGQNSSYSGQAYCRVLWKRPVAVDVAFQIDVEDLSK